MCILPDIKAYNFEWKGKRGNEDQVCSSEPGSDVKLSGLLALELLYHQIKKEVQLHNGSGWGGDQ